MDEEEIALWNDCRRKIEAACKRLVLRYFALAKRWAARIARFANWADQEDLVQDGVIGLINAVKNFDVSRGGSFTTYAHSYVRGAILDSRELTRNLGRRQQEICEEIKRAEQVLAHRLERIPTKEEVASETGLSVEQILNAIDAMGLAFARDLSEDAEPSASRAAGPPQETAALIHDALARLTEREQLIVADHYFEGLSDAEIALRHNMTKDSAKKTRQRAIKKLRRLLDEGSGGS